MKSWSFSALFSAEY